MRKAIIIALMALLLVGTVVAHVGYNYPENVQPGKAYTYCSQLRDDVEVHLNTHGSMWETTYMTNTGSC